MRKDWCSYWKYHFPGVSPGDSDLVRRSWGQQRASQELKTAHLSFTSPLSLPWAPTFWDWAGHFTLWVSLPHFKRKGKAVLATRQQVLGSCGAPHTGLIHKGSWLKVQCVNLVFKFLNTYMYWGKSKNPTYHKCNPIKGYLLNILPDSFFPSRFLFISYIG